MKLFYILDNVSNNVITKIESRDGKTALKKFLCNYCMSTGMYETHKEKDGFYHMTSSYGSEFIAIPSNVKKEA